MKATKLFDLLDDWRHLPAYQLERRADIFFALYLDKILGKLKNASVDLIIPEFPLRLGELPCQNSKKNSSFKIDYLVYSKTQNKVYLIELKTDLRSRRTVQDEYYDKAQVIGLKAIIDGIIKIYNSTRQKVKYSYLLNKLEGIGWIEQNEHSIQNLVKDIEIAKIYIQPLNKDNDLAVISFDNIISVISDSKDELTNRFIDSLKKWKKNPNEKE